MRIIVINFNFILVHLLLLNCFFLNHYFTVTNYFGYLIHFIFNLNLKVTNYVIIINDLHYNRPLIALFFYYYYCIYIYIELFNI